MKTYPGLIHKGVSKGIKHPRGYCRRCWKLVLMASLNLIDGKLICDRCKNEGLLLNKGTEE